MKTIKELISQATGGNAIVTTKKPVPLSLALLGAPELAVISDDDAISEQGELVKMMQKRNGKKWVTNFCNGLTRYFVDAGKQYAKTLQLPNVDCWGDPISKVDFDNDMLICIMLNKHLNDIPLSTEVA